MPRVGPGRIDPAGPLRVRVVPPQERTLPAPEPGGVAPPPLPGAWENAGTQSENATGMTGS
ncbi:predicted protein [Streptomyces sp. C]|nr:predicted protein [Streptomyces sp. C]